jgi:hypothetical protein
LRKAHAIVKSFPNVMETKPVSVEVGSTETSDDSKSAIDLLYELAEKQRRLSPELTIRQAFARVYENPEYSKLAQAERRSNRPIPFG